MGLNLEIKYFNSFLGRKVIGSQSTHSLWAGNPYNPDFYPTFPCGAIDSLNNWYVEESRIRGEYNNSEMSYGVRAYFSSGENSNSRLSSSIIYSGLYNSKTSVNEVNVFSVAEDISKSVDPRYGSIQLLSSDDSNLLILQEEKISSALIDRDVLYTAEGTGNVTATDRVIGDIRSYSGDFGIGKNPESFARNSNRKYFSDVPNNAVLRLSTDGLTEISKYGMTDFFRDEFRDVSNSRKRYSMDVNWDVVFSSPISKITVRGDNVKYIDIGMGIEGINGVGSIYIVDIDVKNNGDYDLTLNKEITVIEDPQESVIQIIGMHKDLVVGGFDNNLKNYTLSVKKLIEPSSIQSQIVRIPSNSVTYQNFVDAGGLEEGDVGDL